MLRPKAAILLLSMFKAIWKYRRITGNFQLSDNMALKVPNTATKRTCLLFEGITEKYSSKI